MGDGGSLGLKHFFEISYFLANTNSGEAQLKKITLYIIRSMINGQLKSVTIKGGGTIEESDCDFPRDRDHWVDLGKLHTWPTWKWARLNVRRFTNQKVWPIWFWHESNQMFFSDIVLCRLNFEVFFRISNTQTHSWKTSSNCRVFFIGPESDHWLCLSLTHSLTNWLTHSLLFSKLDVTLAC